MAKPVFGTPPALPDGRSGEVVFLWLFPVVAVFGIVWKLTGLPLPACVFHGLIGLPCPTCGMNRGFGLLLSGDVFGAAALNPLTVLLPLILLVAWVVCLLRQARWLPSGMTGGLSGRFSMGMRLATVFLFAGTWVYVMARKFG